MSALPFRVKEMEEKIVIPPERYFIVDCPTLHLIAAEHVEPRRHQISSGLWVFDRAFCPQCRQVITKARQIPSACFTVDDYADGPTATAITQITVPSPVPTPVPSPGIPGLRSARYDGRAESILSTPSNSSASPPPRWSAPLPVIEDVPIPEFRPYSPDLPEVVPSQEKQVEDQSNRGPSTFGKSSKLGQFFKRSSVGRDKPEKPAKPERPKGSSKSVSSHDSVSSTLPKIMSFCFSATGKNLLLWKKESEVLVRIELDTFGGRAIDLGDLLPEVEGERVVHIRHVVEGNEVLAVVLSHNHGTMLLVLHESGLASHASLRPLEARQIPTCLAISPDNEYVAVGLGIHVLLLRYSGFNLQSGVTLTVPDFTSPSHIKFQTCSFAPDSSCLVVSTQRNDPRRSTDDDAVYTYVWPCQQVPGDPTRLWMCKMPTDGQGLTTVQFLPSLSLGFITGLTPTPYHLFLSPASQQLPQTPSKILEYRIRCSCFCPAPYNHILYFMDVKNKIHKVDMRTRRIQQVADVNTNRGALRPSEEHAILGATADGHLRVFWRQGAGLWALEVREGSSSTKRNLRPVWLDAMGG